MLCRFRFRKMAQGFFVSPLPSSHVWISAATRGLDAVGKEKPGGANFRPARIALYKVAIDQQRRNGLQRINPCRIADAGRLDRDQRLDLVGPGLRRLEAEGTGLAVKQDDARTEPVDLGD